jgi:hypothetical protein
VKSFEIYKREALKNPRIRAEYEKLAPEFAVARALIGARIGRKLTIGLN